MLIIQLIKNEINKLGEENEECEVELRINLNDLQIEAIEIYEDCFIRIEN